MRAPEQDSEKRTPQSTVDTKSECHKGVYDSWAFKLGCLEFTKPIFLKQTSNLLTRHMQHSLFQHACTPAAAHAIPFPFIMDNERFSGFKSMTYSRVRQLYGTVSLGTRDKILFQPLSYSISLYPQSEDAAPYIPKNEFTQQGDWARLENGRAPYGHRSFGSLYKRGRVLFPTGSGRKENTGCGRKKDSSLVSYRTL